MVFQNNHKKAAKLSLDKVFMIRQLYGEGYTQGQLARQHGVSINTIGRIVRGETWSEGAEAREPTEQEMKESKLRVMAMMRQHERERAFDTETGHASPPGAATARFEDALVSPQVKALRDRLLGYDEEPKRASPPSSLLDGGDAPAEVEGQGLARLEEVARAEGLDVEVALRRSST